MTNTNFLDDFFYYYHDWNKRDENVGRSFTYGACLYDGVREHHFDLDEFSWRVDDTIQSESGANREWVEQLDDTVKVELLDIAYLDELVSNLIEETQQEQQEELFDDLDTDTYKTREDLEYRVSGLIDNYQYIDKTLGNVCDEYEEDRGIDYEEQLFDELDGITFANKAEIIGAIQEYYYGGEEITMQELSKCGELADEYIANRNLELNDEENE